MNPQSSAEKRRFETPISEAAGERNPSKSEGGGGGGGRGMPLASSSMIAEAVTGDLKVNSLLGDMGDYKKLN